MRQLPVHAALLAGLVLATLLAGFVLTALPALMLLVGFVLTALLAGLAALLRVTLVLLISLRILVLVSHLGCSPVGLETPARRKTTRNSDRGSWFHCSNFQQLIGNPRKITHFCGE